MSFCSVERAGGRVHGRAGERAGGQAVGRSHSRSRAAAILHRIVEASAALEGVSVAKLKSEMMQRIEVIIAAQNTLTIARRAEARMRPGNSASKRAIIEATLLEAEP